jgi:hypothetical protein
MIMFGRLAAVSSLLCYCLLFIACTDTGVDNGEEIVFPETGVSYTEHVQPYFFLSCATSGCHDDRTMAGNPPLSLTSYLNATASPGIVIPGDPDASLLIQKVDGRLPHEVFVPIIINDNQLQGLRTWIDEGAKNN